MLIIDLLLNLTFSIKILKIRFNDISTHISIYEINHTSVFWGLYVLWSEGLWCDWQSVGRSCECFGRCRKAPVMKGNWSNSDTCSLSHAWTRSAFSAPDHTRFPLSSRSETQKPIIDQTFGWNHTTQDCSAGAFRIQDQRRMIVIITWLGSTE